MGDLEAYEVNALRRDRELDIYYDWRDQFPFNGEPRQNLVSWLRFTWYCTPCGRDVEVTKRGDHSYEGDCEHVFDREGIDLSTAEYAREREYHEAMWRAQLVECPTHLIKVEVLDYHRSWLSGATELTLSCRCRIVEVERKPCPSCPRLSDGHGGEMYHHQRVIKYVTVNQRQDPTAGYVLECGHTTIDF